MAKKRSCCLVCEKERKKEELASFFVLDQEAYMDLKGQCFNPKACVCQSAECLNQAFEHQFFLTETELSLSDLEEKRKTWLVALEQHQKEKLMHLLTLGYRASYLACGRMASSLSIKKGKALALLLAKDLAKHTREEMLKLAKHFNCPSYYVLDKESLGQVTRQEERACLTVENEAFLQGIKPYLLEEIK